MPIKKYKVIITDQAVRELSPPAVAALRSIAMGESIQECMKSAGISESTTNQRIKSLAKAVGASGQTAIYKAALEIGYLYQERL